MAHPRSIAAAIAVAWSLITIASAEPEFEANANPMIRGSDNKLSSRLTQSKREQDADELNDSPLGREHDVRKLQSSSCSGDNMMCGCSDVRQSDYRGHFSVTQNGFNCKEWSMAARFPNDGLDDGAFCRNPKGVGQRAWCFVEDGSGVMWDYCDVTMCEVESSSSNRAVITGCFNTARYDELYADIEEIKNSIGNDVDRSHFLGGIVRMVAHDFMDFDVNNKRKPMGADGCLLFESSMNVGLGSIWCDSCPLKQLYDEKYSDLSRADFWVAAGNAVIYLTSLNNALDLRNTFYWGRTTVDSCPGSDSRLPTTGGCQDVEGVFLDRMGLTWNDAVALLGAHTLGRGNIEVRTYFLFIQLYVFPNPVVLTSTLNAHPQFSGHHGTWVPNDKDAQVFDKVCISNINRVSSNKLDYF